jgi:site-specific DNA-methyltransferase (adenine-specific)
MLEVNKIHLGDCMELMEEIDSQSCDLILCDLPYGQTSAKWDSMIPLEQLWVQYKRIVKPDGNIVLTAIQPFTSMLVLSNKEMFRYELTWVKSKTTGFTDAKYRPLRKHENILLFSYSSPNFSSKIRGQYFPQGLIEVNKKRTIGKNKFPEIYDKAGIKHPTSVLEFKSEGKTIHPTQKPLSLFTYLVKTFSKPNGLILDSCIGSGTTAIVTLEAGEDRKFIGIEKDVQYWEKANNRLSEHQSKISS